jgi:hypothetical protein
MKLDNIEYVFGCDPELFIWDTHAERFVGAHGIVPGTKDEPYIFDEGGMVQVDGMALEFGIPPARTTDEFVANIDAVMGRIRQLFDTDRYILKAQPSVTFDREVIEAQPPEQLILGCEPDFNAYSGEANPRPAPQNPYFRTSGGHIHIGWGSEFDMSDPDLFMQCRLLSQQLDGTILPLSSLWDNDDMRRTLYGAPGAFRTKSYGMEYRSLSSAWMSEERFIRAAIDGVQGAIRDLHAGKFWAERRLANGGAMSTALRTNRRASVAARYAVQQHVGIMPTKTMDNKGNYVAV